MHMLTTIRTAITVAALSGCAALTAVAQAAPPADVPSAVVKYDPARAATEQGASELYRRIAAAAAQVCPAVSSFGLVLNAQVRQCRQDAIERAVGEIHERHLVEIAAKYAHRG